MFRTHLLVPLLAFVVLGAPDTVRAQEFLGKRLEKWRADLDDKDAQVRRGGAFALGKFPDSANRVVPHLLKRIKVDQDASVRDAAATALGDVMMVASSKSDKTDLKVYWDDAEPILRQKLETETDERALRGVLYAIGGFGPQAGPLLDKVLEKLKDEEPSIRQNAAWALGRLAAEKMEEREPSKRQLKEWAERLEENAGKTIPALSKCLDDKDPLVRRDAATALGDVAAQSLDAGQNAPNPALVKLADQATRALLAMVKNETDDVVKKTALEKLIVLIPLPAKDAKKSPYADAADSLCELLTNIDPELSHLAAFVLAKIGGKEAEPAVEVLGKALHDEEPDTQRRAAASLEILGPHAAGAVSDLCQELRTSTDENLRVHCANALGRIGKGAKAAIPDLVAVLKSNDSLKVRHYTAEAIKSLVTVNDSALPDILEVLAKKEPDNEDPRQDYTTTTIRQRCIWYLFKYDKQPKEAIPVLTAILDEQSDAGLMVRYDAARVLAGDLREKAPDKAVDWLLHMLRNEKLNIYFGSDANVSGGGSEASTGDATLTAKKGGDARFIAAEALGWMGKKASSRQDVVDELKKAAAGAKDEKLKEEARKALKTLGVK